MEKSNFLTILYLFWGLIAYSQGERVLYSYSKNDFDKSVNKIYQHNSSHCFIIGKEIIEHYNPQDLINYHQVYDILSSKDGGRSIITKRENDSLFWMFSITEDFITKSFSANKSGGFKFIAKYRVDKKMNLLFNENSVDSTFKVLEKYALKKSKLDIDSEGVLKLTGEENFISVDTVNSFNEVYGNYKIYSINYYDGFEKMILNFNESDSFLLKLESIEIFSREILKKFYTPQIISLFQSSHFRCSRDGTYVFYPLYSNKFNYAIRFIYEINSFVDSPFKILSNLYSQECLGFCPNFSISPTLVDYNLNYPSKIILNY